MITDDYTSKSWIWCTDTRGSPDLMAKSMHWKACLETECGERLYSCDNAKTFGMLEGALKPWAVVVEYSTYYTPEQISVAEAPESDTRLNGTVYAFGCGTLIRILGGGGHHR